MKAEIELYFVAISTRLYGDENFALRQRFADSLSQLGEPLMLPESGGTGLAFAISEVAPEDCPTSLESNRHTVWRERYFLARATMDVDIGAIKARAPDIEISNQELLYHIASDTCERFLGDLAFLANIASPGSLELSAATMLISDYPRDYSFGELQNDLERMTKRVGKLGWPTLRELPLVTVWHWAQSLTGYSDGLVKGRIGRALAAASFLVTANSEGVPADLTWALMGLEALFSKGTQGLKLQIIEKSGVLLGRPKAFRRKFDGIYDYRSRFVHGDLDIPLAHCLNYETTPISEFDSAVDECRELAAAMLFASLQEIANNGWDDLEFEYKLIIPGSPRES